MDAWHALFQDLLIVLAAGFASGLVCRRFGISLLVGYLIVGAVIGDGGLHWVSQENRELEFLARGGVLLLLFAIGLEFCFDEFVANSRFFFLGGMVQMTVATAGIAASMLLLLPWRTALLIGLASALSSTVLVFKALAEWGQTDSPHGRRAVGILLFQDVALVPLILLMPLLTGADSGFDVRELLRLVVNSIVFVGAVPLVRRLMHQVMIPLLVKLRSRELLVLFSLTFLGATAWCAARLGLPPAIGAFAAGLMLSGSRLSAQIDALVLPFRESFAALFFVAMGTLLHPAVFLRNPMMLITGLVLLISIKTLAGTLALRTVGLPWRGAFGMGLGLAQLGEFSFVLFSEALGRGLLTPTDYSRLLFLAGATLLLTPKLIAVGLRLNHTVDSVETELPGSTESTRRGVVVGAGPIGVRIGNELTARGVDVCLVDLSPINLHGPAQHGMHTVSGDAADTRVLRRAKISETEFVVVCVPKDEASLEIVRSIRTLNSKTVIVVRCRFEENCSAILNAGANSVVSEEERGVAALLDIIRSRIVQTDSPDTT